MTDEHDHDHFKHRLAEEAANIVRRLDENPEDTQAKADERDFLARGHEEQRIYALAKRAFSATSKGIERRERNRTLSFALLGAMLASTYLAWEPMSVRLQADHRSDRTVESAVLKSGDVAVLDAASALVDKTDETARMITVLQGAAYFDVDTDGRRFMVSIDDLTVEALGTQFEVVDAGASVRVSVAEGVVELRTRSSATLLAAGEQALITGDGIEKRSLALEDVARWRKEELILTGLSLRDAAAIIERRLPGRVIVIGKALGDTQVGGSLDLSQPQNALATLAATGNAEALQASKFLTVIYRR